MNCFIPGVAALIIVILVVLFVIALHFFKKWQARKFFANYGDTHGQVMERCTIKHNLKNSEQCMDKYGLRTQEFPHDKFITQEEFENWFLLYSSDIYSLQKFYTVKTFRRCWKSCKKAKLRWQSQNPEVLV